MSPLWCVSLLLLPFVQWQKHTGCEVKNWYVTIRVRKVCALMWQFKHAASFLLRRFFWKQCKLNLEPWKNTTYCLTWYPKYTRINWKSHWFLQLRLNVWEWNSILREMKPTYCCVRFSFKRLQWLRLLQMTLDWFPLCKVVLNFFVYSVTSCQPELALQLKMGFNPDLAQMLMVNSYCY